MKVVFDTNIFISAFVYAGVLESEPFFSHNKNV